MAVWGRFPRGRRKPPRKVEGGITARNRRGAIGETWWSARFVDVLESFAIGSRLTRGRSYARGGQVLDLRVGAGLVSARVQGSRRKPYDVRIGVGTLSARAWKQLEEALGGQALYAARLLAGEMPHEIEEVFAALDLSLFPATSRELETDCSCPDVANPCKHIAATYYILAEAFDDDPFLIFAWRGRTRDELVTNLRRLRGAPSGGKSAPEGADVRAAAEDAPLAASLDDFWRTDPSFSGLHVAPRASDSPDALLRQLGPPPPDAGGAQLLERLASAYHAMASRAETLAYEDARGPAAPDEPPPPMAPDPRGRFYVTDMSHFSSEEDDDEMPPPARRLYDFLGGVVKTATSLRAGEQVRTALRCRRTRGRTPCRGHLVVRLVETPAEITWSCAVCGEAGVVRGWECSIHDLGGRLVSGDGSDGSMIQAMLSEEQYRLLESIDLIDLSAEQLVRGAILDRGEIRLAGTREEFAALTAELAVAIDRAGGGRRRTRLQELQRLLER